jgi:hypothetical protein
VTATNTVFCRIPIVGAVVGPLVGETVAEIMRTAKEEDKRKALPHDGKEKVANLFTCYHEMN